MDNKKVKKAGAFAAPLKIKLIIVANTITKAAMEITESIWKKLRSHFVYFLQSNLKYSTLSNELIYSAPIIESAIVTTTSVNVIFTSISVLL